MERRQFVGTAATLASGLLAAGGISKAWADESKPAKSDSRWEIQDKAALEKVTALKASLFACLKAGQACETHCQEQLAQGETVFADCAAGVAQMLAVCEATTRLTSMKSVRLKEILGTCIVSCQSCKEACDKHAEHFKHGMHLVCKECSEACAKVAADAKKLQESLA